MSSMAQQAIDMGIDPVIAPDGREWCESAHRQSDTSREMWGDLQDGCNNNYVSDYEDDDYSDIYRNEIVYEVGDIVKLNSSDVLMTIKSIDDNILTCRWFDKNDNIQNDKFNIVEISLVEKIENHQDSLDSKNKIPEIDIDEDEIPF